MRRSWLDSVAHEGIVVCVGLWLISVMFIRLSGKMSSAAFTGHFTGNMNIETFTKERILVAEVKNLVAESLILSAKLLDLLPQLFVASELRPWNAYIFLECYEYIFLER